MQKVIGIGNALVDIILKLHNDEILNMFKLPKGSMQLVDAETANKIENACFGLNSSMASGGSAANTIHGLSRLGVSTGFIGTVGNDDMGQFFHEDMIKTGIEPFLSRSTTPTGRAISLVSPDTERTFATYLGAAVEINESDLSDTYLRKYDIMHLEGYLAPLHQYMESIMKKAKDFGLQVSLDLASYNVVESNLDFLHRIVGKYVDIVFANEEEAKAFTGIEDPVEALNCIARSCKIAVVKTGKHGSLVKCADEVFSIGIIPAHCIDTTGAGDLYAAGFLYGIIKGYAFDKCGKIGSLLAANVIEELGAKIPGNRWEKILEVLSGYE